MRKDLMDILACPVCRSSLSLSIESEDDQSAEVISGKLTCAECPASYPIVNSIPDLLPPDLRKALATE